MSENNVTKGVSKLLPQYNVEGFDPNEALTRVIGVDATGQQTESLFMKYAPAMAWFLTVYPDGCLNHTFNILNAQKATVTASVYRSANDARPAATATCSRYYDETENGRYYEQNAVTAAYRKALGYLGFGTPIDAHVVDGISTEMINNIPEMTDAGVPIMAPAFPAGLLGTEASAVPAEPAEPAKRRGRRKKTEDNAAIMVDDPNPNTESAPEPAEVPAPVAEELPAPVEENTPAPAAKEVPAPTTEDIHPTETKETAASYEVQSALDFFAQVTAPARAKANAASVTPMPEPVKTEPAPEPEKAEEAQMSLEEASQVLVPRGEMRGKTIEEAAKLKGNEFIRWHYEKARMMAPNSPFAKAAEIYCEFYGC